MAVNQMITERTTDTVAVGAVASPVWLPWLSVTSEIAAMLLPIAGLSWLFIQIVGYFLRGRAKLRGSVTLETKDKK